MSETDNINDSSKEPADDTTAADLSQADPIPRYLLENHFDRIASVSETTRIGSMTSTIKITLRQGGGE